MLAYIKGTLEIKLKNYVVIDVGGLGYKVFMSESSIDSLGEIGRNRKSFILIIELEKTILVFMVLKPKKNLELLNCF